MKYFDERKQRKLVRWAVAYIAGAFALMQGIDIIAQRFGWAESVRRGITLAMVLGLLVVLVLAWYRGERGAQQVSGTELLFQMLLIAIGGGLLWKCASKPPLPMDGAVDGNAEKQRSIDETSIPFALFP